MTDAERDILDKVRAGRPITPADTVATISMPDELAAYERGLQARGGLTGDAVTAINARRMAMGWK
jgi:hypothetical protein